jgi:iron complex outermembrane receptor protein
MWQAVTTDSLGRFELTWSQPGSYTLDIQFVGFSSQRQTYRLKADQVLDVVISMKPIPTELQTVVITEGRYEKRLEEVTVSLDVIKPQLLENKNSQTIETGLNQTPGVVVIDQQANIRSGSGWSYGTGSRVLVLVDDMPILAPDAGRVQWNLAPVEAVHQMEVIKGGASALFGTSAMNGVVNLRTTLPSSSPRTQVTSFFGVWDQPPGYIKPWYEGVRTTGGAQFVHSQKQGNRGLVLSGFYLQDQGYKYLEESVRARMHFKTEFDIVEVPGLTLGLNGNYTYSSNGEALIWETDTNGYIPLDSSATRNYSAHFYFDPWLSYRHGKVKHTFRNRLMRLDNTSADRNATFDNRSLFTYSEYQVQWFAHRHLTLSGGAVGAFGESESEVFGGYHNTRNAAAYAQVEGRLGRLLLIGGMRYEYFALDSFDFHRPVFRLGANYEINPGLNARASFGQGFRFPSMGEFYATTNVGNIVIYPNQELKPEEGWSGEVGLKQGLKWGKTWRGFVDVSAFWMEYINMMEFSFAQWGPLNGPFFGAGFKSVNTGPARITGLEASVVGQGKIGGAQMAVLAGYTYANPIALEPDKAYAQTSAGLDVTFANSSSDTTGNVLKYRYKHLVRADVQVDFKRFLAGFSVRYNSFMQNIDGIFESPIFEGFIPNNGIKSSRETLQGGDFVLDVRLGYAFFEGFEAMVLVDNALNEAFQPRPATWGPPRKYALRVTYSW